MFCKNCGSKLEDNIKFCPECGQAVYETLNEVNNGSVLINNDNGFVSKNKFGYNIIKLIGTVMLGISFILPLSNIFHSPIIEYYSLDLYYFKFNIIGLFNLAVTVGEESASNKLHIMVIIYLLFYLVAFLRYFNTLELYYVIDKKAKRLNINSTEELKVSSIAAILSSVVLIVCSVILNSDTTRPKVVEFTAPFYIFTAMMVVSMIIFIAIGNEEFVGTDN